MENDFKERLRLIIERVVISNKYNLISPSSIKDIVAFETKFDLQLPEEYRWFVTNIANGVISKQEWGFNLIETIDWLNYWFKEDQYNPAIPFPLTNRTAFYTKEASDDDHPGYPFETTYLEHGPWGLIPKGYRFGEISLMGAGCGADDFLVVKGAEYGNMWMDNMSSNSEVYPAYDYQNLTQRRMGFTDWLEWHVRVYIPEPS